MKTFSSCITFTIQYGDKPLMLICDSDFVTAPIIEVIMKNAKSITEDIEVESDIVFESFKEIFCTTQIGLNSNDSV